MTTQLPFSNNAISVYAYEGFSYTISNPNTGVYTLQTVSNSTGFGPSPSAIYFTKNGNNDYVFSSSDASNNLTPGTQESFILQATGPTTLTSSNTVTINPGRFLDGSGLSLSNNSYTFYKNERITPIRLVAPSFALKPPTSVPTLPPGLSFVSNASNIYDISGIPLVTVPTSNYLIIGAQNGGSKIVTTRINLSVSNERVQLNLSGTPIVNNMQIGTPIATRVFTAIPPIGTTAVRYSYPTFPDGIVVKNSAGVVQTGTSFTATDSSFTMVIEGTPTSNAAYAFRDAGVTSSGVVYPIQVSRTTPLPIVETPTALTFAFGETILFDLSTIPTLYAQVPVDPSANFFRAATYFGGSVGMSNIFSPNLRADLSLAFVPALSRAGLTDTPVSTGSASYTIRAINSNGTTRDYSTTISVSNDSISFFSPTPAVDTCYSFVISRPLTSNLTGYYPSTIQFSAATASGKPVVFSAPALAGTGLSLSNVNPNLVEIVGIPTAVTPLTTVTVTVDACGSPATASRNIKASVLNDAFTFADVSSNSLSFVQNVNATPFQVQATTLSGRGITGYAQTGLPAGLSISPAGVVSGTPTLGTPAAGTVTFSATTGYASGTRDFSFNLTPDSILFAVPQTTYSAQAGQAIGPVDIDGVAYSGKTVSNYDLSISPTYGMTINASNGVLSGTWSTGIPPAALLPSSCNFFVTANAGTLQGVLNANITAAPVVRNAMLFAPYVGGATPTWWWYYTSPELLATPSPLGPQVVQLTTPVAQGTPSAVTKFAFKNNSPSNNVIIASTSSTSGLVYRGTRLDNLTPIFLESAATYNPVASTVVNKGGTSTWWIAGRRLVGGSDQAVVIKSTDDGLTWDVSGSALIRDNGASKIGMTRDSNGSNIPVNSLIQPYVIGGAALAYDSSSGVLMFGGIGDGSLTEAMFRSTDDGSNWSVVNRPLEKECATFNLSNSTWIVAGSSLYQTNDPYLSYSADAMTIKYSTDQGATWTDTSGSFNMFGYDVAYASNTWIATGMSRVNDPFLGAIYREELRYSTDGMEWFSFDLSTSPLVPSSSSLPILAPLRTGPAVSDGNYWYVFVNEGSSLDGYPKIYRHDLSSSLTSNWTVLDLSAINNGFVSNQPAFSANTRYLAFADPRYLYTGEPPTNVTLTFTTSPGVGPTFTSPVSRSFLQYQYVPIDPIQLSATGTGPIYFFVASEALPPGLTFNQTTNQIGGTPVQAGDVTTNVYAKDSSGTTLISLRFSTLVPRIIRQQDGAGAYTSLLRQYTEVLGAQNARDNRVFPTQESRLGEFMSPEAPDVVTQTVDPRCFDPNACL